ncbi:hypothetical protein HBH56_160210 [Parastagonospora nodorum]|uniref:Uncharacterized protein n=1 Tax=Phaeosphaeria nodorum (strain SN15 / ATCC MYA-4574 / FGSC 10173) TaxID=321614 RepID=A0A7U2F2F9_PHANO|nr:hypothetical protein HBH56_160210 [Parastagonospora nodorum]QRC97236.1 hypothetical protein JI435_089700 [Parastagonospora nodorum SN15]KAH3922462.1 hypothetical protein HBH54_224640 [Parastagonospora nodorum]KAH3973517.1 hypothetical protein HBH51_094900 [Parastagonospora nodorum]KAH4106251.1 hypothetical protein HBH46_078490 [Parastagonospora nodorum]
MDSQESYPGSVKTVQASWQHSQQTDASANGVAAKCGTDDISQTAQEHTLFADVLNSPCSTGITAVVEAIPVSQGQTEGATNIADQHRYEEDAVTVPHHRKSKRSKRVSLLTSIDPKNIIDATNDHDEYAAKDTPPISSIPPPSYSLRNRKATRGKLIYDVKYHPMDDSIRPSLAAKRRSLHGEPKTFSAESSEASLAHDESNKDEFDAGERAGPTKKGAKRKRCCSQEAQPTRRSSRKSVNSGISYNMSVHPQDRDLEVSSSDDSDCEMDIPKSKRCVLARSVEDGLAPIPDDHTCETASGIIAIERDQPESNYADSSERAEDPDIAGERSALLKTSSLLSPTTTISPYGVRRREDLDVWMMKPGERYFRHDRDSWPDVQGLPFKIYTESLEAQLAAEAKAASPFNFDHDDKENDTGNGRSEATPGPIQRISAVPLSQYRSTSEDQVVSEAFYSLEPNVSMLYGLGGVDGSSDRSIRAASMSEAMSILASGDGLRREEGRVHAELTDAALSLQVSTPSDVDSVLGRPSSTPDKAHSSSG